MDAIASGALEGGATFDLLGGGGGGGDGGGGGGAGGGGGGLAFSADSAETDRGEELSGGGGFFPGKEAVDAEKEKEKGKDKEQLLPRRASQPGKIEHDGLRVLMCGWRRDVKDMLALMNQILPRGYEIKRQQKTRKRYPWRDPPSFPIRMERNEHRPSPLSSSHAPRTLSRKNLRDETKQE